MLFFLVLVCAVATGRAYVVPQNVVTVPPNCPAGQEWINGQCRDVWYIYAQPSGPFENLNVITVPSNCPPGQEWINGACRDVWKSLYESAVATWNNADRAVLGRPKGSFENSNVITVPTNCPPGQEWINGACRDVWKSLYESAVATWNNADRAVLGRPKGSFENSNVITVPTNCPPGQEWINGACRDVWKTLYESAAPTWNNADRGVLGRLLRDAQVKVAEYNGREK